MIERTKARLDEARALLRDLQDTRFWQVQNANPTASPEFFSRLSAFITTARTVRWVLKSEETKKYEAWEKSPGASLTDEENEIFRLVTEMRNSIEKRGRLGIVARREQVDIPENPHPVAGKQHFGLPEWGRPTTNIDVYYFEGTEHEVISVCEQYVAILSRQVQNFENEQAA